MRLIGCLFPKCPKGARGFPLESDDRKSDAQLRAEVKRLKAKAKRLKAEVERLQRKVAFCKPSSSCMSCKDYGKPQCGLVDFSLDDEG
jgi:hypothetical protein